MFAKLGHEHRPRQLGFSTKLGSKAAAYAAMAYLRGYNHKIVLLKIVLRNAFNCIKKYFSDICSEPRLRRIQAASANIFAANIIILR